MEKTQCRRTVLNVLLTLSLSAAVLLPAFLSTGCGEKTAGSGTERKPAASPEAFLRTYQLQGHVVLVEFGTVGCPLSEKGLLEMKRLNREKTIPDLSYVRVEGSKDRETARDYFAGKAPGFVIHYDSGASVAQAFDATVYPTFVLIDKFGHVRYRGGMPEVAKLVDWVATLQGEMSDPGGEAALLETVSVDSAALLTVTRLPDVDGRITTLGSRMGQGGLLVVFVDTSCPFAGTAIGEMPIIAGKLAGYGIPSVLVNIGNPEQEVREFYAKRQTGTAVLYDVTTDTQQKWAVTSVPTVVLLDRRGKEGYRGNAVWADLARATEKTLGLGVGSVRFEAQGTGFG